MDQIYLLKNAKTTKDITNYLSTINLSILTIQYMFAIVYLIVIQIYWDI